jgi:hypothetical protein
MKRLLILLMLVSQPAWAGWDKVLDEDEFDFYIDFKSIIKTPRGGKFWALQDSYDEQSLGSDLFYKSVKYLIEVDCERDRYRRLRTTLFSGQMGRGKVRLDYERKSWQSFVYVFVPPNQNILVPMEDVMRRAVC